MKTTSFDFDDSMNSNLNPEPVSSRPMDEDGFASTAEAVEEFDSKHQRFLKRRTFDALKHNFEARRQCFLIRHARWPHFNPREVLQLMALFPFSESLSGPQPERCS